MGKKQMTIVYAAYHNNQEIRKNSSSGGLFTAFADVVFAEGGVVCGAIMDAEGKVSHTLIDNREELSKMRGSKYVKSDLSGCYITIRERLENGAKVLFSGTPCQVDGLYHYLDKDYENLLTCDLVCHGTPKPQIFSDYLKYLEKNYNSKIESFSFKNKVPGWKNSSFRGKFENGWIHEKSYGTDPYSIGFQDCYFLTEGCYQCKYASSERIADITLGDFWGFESQNGDMIDTDEGISLVMCNTDKGRQYFDKIKKDIIWVERDIQDALPGNPCLSKCFPKPEQYDDFWEDYKAHGFSYVAEKYLNVEGKVYVDKLNKDTIEKVQGKKVVIVPSDGVGSKGDEAMIRGALNLFKGADITLYTPRDEQWKGWIVDRTDEFEEMYVPLDQLADAFSEPVHMVIIGADIMDGLYGDENGIYRLKAAERVIDMGGIVDVFSCSFREKASANISKQIINIGAGLRFHLRDRHSLTNFEIQTGLQAEFFPDLAFFCETIKTERAEAARIFLQSQKDNGRIIVGVNFNEHSCKGFFANPDDHNRKQYVSDVLQTIKECFSDVCFVIIPHDTKEWRGHYADARYALLAREVLQELNIENYYLTDPLMWEAELLHVIQCLDILVSGRMHLTIAGIRKNVIPVGYMGNADGVSFSNSEKFKGMYQERVGRSDLMVESKEELKQLLEKIQNSVLELKSTISEKNIENNEIALDLIKKYKRSINMNDNLESLDFKKELTDDFLLEEMRYIYEKEQIIKQQRQLQWDMEAEQQQNAELIHNLRQELDSKDKKMQEDEKLLRQKVQEIQEKENLIQEKDNRIQEKENLIQEKDNQIQEKDNQIQEKDNQILCKDGHIDQLLQKERDYVNLLNTKGVRVLKVWWKCKEKMFPHGSKRRLIAKLGKKFLKHPIYMLKKCTPSRIARTVHYMKVESPESVANRLDAATINAGEEVERIKLDLFPVNEHMFDISDVEKLQLPKFDKPLVSIVLPVYNQFHYTYNCIRSIIKNTENVSYEVVLADDCSTDLTKDIEKIVDNIVVVRTPENMRFLKNCNNATKYVKGEYILFLNNDTQVQENWLESLIDLMNKDDKIGMVGSKLLYPDGALQEAGGILWKDGSAWNYGNQRGPLEPEFNYVKEADYISGAAIMIRKSLWEEIGGFDERFAPAYYEDSDLAFEVRKHGYKVMYQPLSQVVHFEGVSNGTDTSSGQKEYQVKNQKKFYEKWKDVLKTEHFSNGENVFWAKDRSRNKKTILVIDHYVPQYDKDAGSRTIWQYIKMFIEKGYNVKFMGDNFYQHEPYTTALQQIGVEVLYGSWYARNYKQWIIDNKDNIDFAYLNRPHITEKYIDFLREETNIKCIYYGHDLHFLRVQREYELNGDRALLTASKEWKKKEFDIMQKADINYYPSYVEVDEIHKIDASIPAKAITAYVYEEFLENLNLDFSKKKGILFVGGFGHPPNEDAVLWFVQKVYPFIREKQEIPFYIVGSNATENIKKLHGEGIELKGFVTEEELRELYNICKLVVVPLRYGAGVKGKVVEALYNGTPMVSTTVGIEGIQGAEDFMEISDEAFEFAEKVLALYNDNEKLAETAKKYQEYVKEHNSIDAAWSIVAEDF